MMELVSMSSRPRPINIWNNNKFQYTISGTGTRKGTTTAGMADRNHYRLKLTDPEYINGLAWWHIVNKSPIKSVGGTIYHWYLHHSKEGTWNGMYTMHEPKDHNGPKRGKKAATTMLTGDGTERKAMTSPCNSSLAFERSCVLICNLAENMLISFSSSLQKTRRLKTHGLA